MDERDSVLSFTEEFGRLAATAEEAGVSAQSLETRIDSTEDQISEILEELLSIPGAVSVVQEHPTQDKDIDAIVSDLNYSINELDTDHHIGDFDVKAVDIIVSVMAGVIASVIDIVFVGTPEVVKIWKGGENFDRSRLTAVLRSIGNGDDKLSAMLKWLSEKCKVPYDLSIVPGIATPNNHRLRNFAHDPLIGVLFAVADILLGTATFVDDTGHLKVVVNSKDFPVSVKLLSLLYYLGHLLSDVCTARGLPIPGFVLTQFFVNGDKGDSLATIAERMYVDGYDLRHLVSMSTPVLVKSLIVDAYLLLQDQPEVKLLVPIAENEIAENREKAYRNRLLLISDAVACSGNALKFFIPPTSGNPTALNLAEWVSLIKSGLNELKYQTRDISVEQAIANRKTISENWEKLSD